MLKINLKSLMAEARYIKQEERKRLSGKACHRMQHPNPRAAAPEPTEKQLERYQPAYRSCPLPDGDHTPVAPYFQLHAHRTGALREEARRTLLAYGFVRGRSYAQVEIPTPLPPRGSSLQHIEEERWAGVWTKVRKYGAPDTKLSQLDAWHARAPVEAVA